VTEPRATPPWQQLRVSMSGAFLTETPLKLGISDHAAAAQRLSSALGREQPGWRSEAGEHASVAGSYSVGGGYASLMANAFVMRDGPALCDEFARARENLAGPERGFLDETLGDSVLELVSARVEIFDFGTGAFELVYDLITPTGMTPAAIVAMVESISALHPDSRGPAATPLAAILTELLVDAAARFSSLASAEIATAVETPWLEPMIRVHSQALTRERPGGLASPDGRASREPGFASPPWGRPLWIHRLYMIKARRDAPRSELEQLAAGFKSSYSRSIADWDDLFVPGIDSSVLATSRESFAAPDDFIPSMILLHWGYAAVIAEADRGLLVSLEQAESSKPNGHLAHLEARAAEALKLRMRVVRLITRLESVMVDFGGGGRELWDALAAVQRFGDAVVAVERKLEALGEIARRRLQQAAVVRERRTNGILLFLAALTLVGLAVALLDGLLGTRTDRPGHIAVRIGGLVLSVLVVALLLSAVTWGQPWTQFRAWSLQLRRGRAGLGVEDARSDDLN
jgi:hypothetical protein